MRLVTDSGGAGKFRGAPGSEIVFGPARGTMQAFYFADFGHFAPGGVLGGADGSLAAIAKVDADGTETPKPVIGDVELSPGEWVRGFESGGGGYGDPLERDPEAVRRDVLDRWVSLDAARDQYGVVLRGDLEECEIVVDRTATEQLRRQLRS
jgi:N-methylhydantoinase B